MEALNRLTIAQRNGVLGKTKADYFDKGLLRTGMIRARSTAVRERLTRQGLV